MKKILLLLIITSLKSYSADWDLFPLGQRSYYIYPFGLRTGVELFVMDSVVVSGGGENQYFRKKINQQNLEMCNTDSIHTAMLPGYEDQLIDSLFKSGDTVYYNSTLSSIPFYFVTHSIQGQSWIITSDYSGNDYNQITISCDSIIVESIFGLTDSVKIFSMTPNGTSSNQIPINNFTMKLSKNYGLIEFVPFLNFLFHPANSNFYTLKLAGFNSGTVQAGYEQPQFSDYFKLSPGDILLWNHHVYPSNILLPSYDFYYRDSIISVNISADSVLYQFERMIEDTDMVITTYTGNNWFFRKNEMGPLVEAIPNWYAFGNCDALNSYLNLPSRKLYWSTSEVLIDIDSLTNDTVTTINLSTMENEIDTNTCSLSITTDIFIEMVFNNGEGLVSNCNNGFGIDCLNLIGSRISGIQHGNISLGIENDYNISSAFHIYPNPPSGNIRVLSDFDLSKADCTISGIDGKIVRKIYNASEDISVEDLTPGIYFVRLKTQKGSFIEKFVKTVVRYDRFFII